GQPSLRRPCTDGGGPAFPIRRARGLAKELPPPPHLLGLLRLCRERPHRSAAEQRDERAAFHVEHGDFLPDALSQPPTGPCSLFRSFSLPQGGRQVLGANLKCSESRRRRPAPHLPLTTPR